MAEKKRYQMMMRVELRPLGQNGEVIYSGSMGSSCLQIDHAGTVQVESLMDAAALIDKLDSVLQSLVEPGSFSLGKNYQ